MNGHCVSRYRASLASNSIGSLDFNVSRGEPAAAFAFTRINNDVAGAKSIKSISGVNQGKRRGGGRGGGPMGNDDSKLPCSRPMCVYLFSHRAAIIVSRLNSVDRANCVNCHPFVHLVFSIVNEKCTILEINFSRNFLFYQYPCILAQYLVWAALIKIHWNRLTSLNARILNKLIEMKSRKNEKRCKVISNVGKHNVAYNITFFFREYFNLTLFLQVGKCVNVIISCI